MNVTQWGHGKKHHRSHGIFSGFVWSAKYSKNGNTSYGRLSTKRGLDGRNIKKLHGKVINEIVHMCDNLNKVITMVIKKGKSVSSALLRHSVEIAPVKYRLTSFHKGLLTGFICKTAHTLESHVEDDCIYTLIGFPFSSNGFNKVSKDLLFEFMWYKDNISGEYGRIQIFLHQGACVYYNGYGIMHLRVFLGFKFGHNKQPRNCWNISCYSNGRFYENVMKSFERMTVVQQTCCISSGTQKGSLQ